VPAPIFSVSPFQIVVQVPYEVAGRQRTAVQCFYKSIPSNTAILEVVDAVPEVIRKPGTTQAAALNQDGIPNSLQTPAEAGSVVSVFATGVGQLTTGRNTGERASAPYGSPALPLSLLVGGKPVEVLFAGEAPGLAGVLQLNVRLPAAPTATPQLYSLSLRVGDKLSWQLAAGIWVK
jgi:uncharacterized protein (TIGR03437 family)